MTYKMAIVR